MKKLLAILLSAVMVLSLVACGQKEEPAPAPAPEAGQEEAPTAKTVKVGLICIGDENDQGYTYNFIRGKEAATEALAADGLISFDKISIIGDGYALDGGAICKRITTAIRKNTAAVIMTACPNVCSLQLPIAEIGAFCRRRGILFIVDGAQAAGHFPIDMRSMCIDALCLPGHKGLLGPQGSGALILGEGIMPRVIFEGGSGSSSFEAEMPREIPERYEAGTLSTPAIAGLCEGVRYIRRLGLASIEKHERSLFLYARQRLGSIPKVRIYMPQYAGSVLSFNVGTLPSDRVASALGTAGICTRGGFHCNPWAHTALGTDAHGSVRISFSPFNTPQDVDALALALGELSRK